MESPAPAATVKAAAPTTTAVKAATTTAAAVEAAAATAVTAALAECGIGRESKNRESSKRDEGSNLTKYAHNLTFPSSVVTDFQLQSLRISCPIKFSSSCMKSRGNPCYSRKPPL